MVLCGATSKEVAPIGDSTKISFHQSSISATTGSSTTKRIPLPAGGALHSAKVTLVVADRPCGPVLIDCYVAYLRGDSYEGDMALFTKWFADDNDGHGARNPSWIGNLRLAGQFRPFLVVSIINKTGTTKQFEIYFQVEQP